MPPSRNAETDVLNEPILGPTSYEDFKVVQALATDPQWRQEAIRRWPGIIVITACANLYYEVFRAKREAQQQPVGLTLAQAIAYAKAELNSWLASQR